MRKEQVSAGQGVGHVLCWWLPGWHGRRLVCPQDPLSLHLAWGVPAASQHSMALPCPSWSPLFVILHLPLPFTWAPTCCSWGHPCPHLSWLLVQGPWQLWAWSSLACGPCSLSWAVHFVMTALWSLWWIIYPFPDGETEAWRGDVTGLCACGCLSTGTVQLAAVASSLLEPQRAAEGLSPWTFSWHAVDFV